MATFPNFLCLSFSLFLNLFFLATFFSHKLELTWSKKAAEKAEDVGSIYCSGHGHAYYDGVLSQGKQVCECNTCYGGSDCSEFLSDCPANADSGDPLFLEKYWVDQAMSSAVMVSGWHRMSYSMPNSSFISAELERHILRLHAVVGNAVTDGKYIIFGVGSTQLLHAAVHALSSSDASSKKPMSVVADVPYYSMYPEQTNVFKSKDFEWQGDASTWKNMSNNSAMNFIEFVTSPNNPDCQLRHSVLAATGSSVQPIYDRAYYWPYYSAILAPANEDLMIFTISKVTGHAGSRFGWALIKDEGVYIRLLKYIRLNSMGVSRETQLRALELLKVVLEGEEGGGRSSIFAYGHKILRERWLQLNNIISQSKRFSLQNLSPLYSTYFQKIQQPSPGYAWLKCEIEKDQDCYAVLEAAGIIGRAGNSFGAENRYVRLSLLRSDDDFNLLFQKLDTLVSNELFKIL